MVSMSLLLYDFGIAVCVDVAIAVVVPYDAVIYVRFVSRVAVAVTCIVADYVVDTILRITRVVVCVVCCVCYCYCFDSCYRGRCCGGVWFYCCYFW